MPNIEQVLRERANKIAQVPQQKDVLKVEKAFIQFRLANEVYAIEAAVLSQAQRYIEPTPVPNLDDCFLGIVYLQGRFVSVINFAKFMKIEEADPKPSTKRSLVLLANSQIEFCLMVDEILGQVEIDLLTLQPLTVTGHFERSEVIKGITEEALTVLDANALLNHPLMQLYQLQEDPQKPFNQNHLRIKDA